MRNPEISIIVPVYNGRRYLAETLRSLLAQTFANFELIAVDDGSTDDSCDVIRSMDDERIRLVQTANGGLAAALNRGIAEARAPFIARNDQDDISFPNRLERQFNLLTERQDALGVFAYTAKFGGRHEWSNADKVKVTPGTVKQFHPITDGCIVCSTMFMRTEALRQIGGFRQEYYPVDDWDLELRAAESGTLLVICEPLVAYRFHASANTYRLFAEMRAKTRWTENSYCRRQQSLPEQTFEQFRQSSPRDLWTRLRHFRKDSAALHMRVAGQRLLDGKYISAAYHLSASGLLHPPNLASRVTRLARRR